MWNQFDNSIAKILLLNLSYGDNWYTVNGRHWNCSNSASSRKSTSHGHRSRGMFASLARKLCSWIGAASSTSKGHALISKTTKKIQKSPKTIKTTKKQKQEKPIDDARFNEVTDAMTSFFDGGIKNACRFNGNFAEMFSGSSAGSKEMAAIMDDTDHDNGTTSVLKRPASIAIASPVRKKPAAAVEKVKVEPSEALKTEPSDDEEKILLDNFLGK